MFDIGFAHFVQFCMSGTRALEKCLNYTSINSSKPEEAQVYKPIDQAWLGIIRYLGRLWMEKKDRLWNLTDCDVGEVSADCGIEKDRQQQR